MKVHSEISFESVSMVFNGTTVIGDLNFQVEKGERVAILGRTGAGKSTLLNLLVGNLEPTSGTVRVADIDPYSQHSKLQGILAMAFQSPRLLPWRNALDNVAVGREILGEGKRARRENAKHWLSRVDLAGYEKYFPSQLSGGMRQRLSLARAFSIDPAVILLDEAFSALDEVTARTLRADFVKLANDVAATCLVVTHNIEEAFEIADRVIVLGRPARILAEYRCEELPSVGTPEFTSVRMAIHKLLAGE